MKPRIAAMVQNEIAPPRSREQKNPLRFGTLIATLAYIVLPACTSTSLVAKPEEKTAPTPIRLDMAALPGDYGLASYHREEDGERTLAQAMIACSNPYNIGAGANGGILMHAIGQSQPSEIFWKVDKQGRSYLGPKGPTGVPQDRLVISYDEGVLVTEWIDPQVRSVYGTMVYVPCENS